MAPGTTWCFTDRTGGVSSAPYASLNLGHHVGDDDAAVAENRHRAAQRLGGAPVAWMTQVHGRAVAVLDDAPTEPVAGVDALVTRNAALTLGVLVADCVPVLIEGPGVVAVAHAGRKGLQLGIVPATLDVLDGLGTAPEALRAHLGPAACGACYEVPEPMRDEVAAGAPAAASRTSWGTPALDIRAGVAEQLRGYGVRVIDVSPICTIESEVHYSYRRDGTTGRFAGLVRRAAIGT